MLAKFTHEFLNLLVNTYKHLKLQTLNKYLLHAAETTGCFATINEQLRNHYNFFCRNMLERSRTTETSERTCYSTRCKKAEKHHPKIKKLF